MISSGGTPPPFRILVPARYASMRLPGKPLRDLAGKPLILRVWEAAQQCGGVEVVVATDDARIAQRVESVGGRAVLTRADHATGTDRIAEVAERFAWPDDEIVVNLQGDEPFVAADVPRRLASALALHPMAGIATAAVPITDLREIFNPNVVKVVVAANGFGLYFSRAPIPWVRGVYGTGGAGEVPRGVPLLRHVGLYAYRVGTLRALQRQGEVDLERAEALEQLRALVLGIPIHVTTLEAAPPPGIDTEEDLAAAVRYFETGGQRS